MSDKTPDNPNTAASAANAQADGSAAPTNESQPVAGSPDATSPAGSHAEADSHAKAGHEASADADNSAQPGVAPVADAVEADNADSTAESSADASADAGADVPVISAGDISAPKKKLHKTSAQLIESIDLPQMRELADFCVGDTVSVQVKVIEGERRRIQSFIGVVIAKRNRGLNSSFRVRKKSRDESVERVFQSHSPLIDSVKVKTRGRVRRAKLYYLRKLSGLAARIEEKIK